MSETNDSFPVQVTQAALDQIKNLITRKGDDSSFLRIGVKGGGCSGLEYLFKLDNNPRENDFVYTKDNITIRLDPKSATYLNGSTLEFTGNLLGGGFAFNNPNASRSCGCGTSFTPKPR